MRVKRNCNGLLAGCFIFDGQKGGEFFLILPALRQCHKLMPEQLQYSLLNAAAVAGEPVIYPWSSPLLFHPAGMVQGAQMPGDRGLRQVKNRHQVADAVLAIGEQGENPQTNGFGQGLKEVCYGIHEIYISA